ncbi:MAG: tripartite tricarboxylate transporter substrate binding protein [Betaproteobacteria bacterium]|nr:tripartite tricarboxylate transporter substrate binding protein [Betaproteobacteria bacterium]
MKLLTVLATLACSACITTALAQQKPPTRPGGYPVKPVRVLVGSPAGSGSDVMMRAVAQKLTERWGQSVIVDNRPGAAGAISLQLTVNAIPDGYTLATLSAQNVTAMILGTVTTDIPKELMPVVLMITQPYLMVATPSLPAGSVKELIALAKAKPLVYASSGTGSVVHLGMELFKSLAGVEMIHIPYKGSGLSMIDVMSGRVQLAITNTLTATPLVRSGKLKALAITSSQRVQAFPDLPTVAEAGVPGYELRSWYGLLAPNGTPAPLVVALNREVSQTMNSPEVRGKLAADGAETAVPNTPAQFKSVIAGETAKWEKVIRKLGVKEK